MTKESMTEGEVIAVIIMFIFGSSVIMGVGGNVEQDTWIALIISILMIIPLILIYARIIKLYPGKCLFEIIKSLFGKVMGTILIILVTWYALHLGAMVVRNFSEYIEITTLLNTPQIVIMILLLSTCLYIGRSKMEIFGRWGLIVLPILLITLVITIILSLGIINTNNLLPIMSHNIKNITGSAFSIAAFPFGEVVLFLALADSIKKQDSSYKIYLWGILIGSLCLLITFLRNVSVLGPTMMESTYFPSFMATRVIEVGDFLTRIEGAATINFIFAGITKITVCLIAASKGISYLFNVKNYRSLILPTSLIMLTLSEILYINVMEMFDFIKIYPVYAVPFQIIIPVTIWIVAERKVRKDRVLS